MKYKCRVYTPGGLIWLTCYDAKQAIKGAAELSRICNKCVKVVVYAETGKYAFIAVDENGHFVVLKKSKMEA